MQIEPENIVLITIDCLRKDSLGVFGSKAGCTPFVDTLAKNSIVFHNCYTASATTSPSFGSYFTSKNPFNHGARFSGDKIDMEKNSSFVEILNGNYYTGGFSSVENLNSYFNFDKGFQDFFDHLDYYTGLRNFGFDGKYNLLNVLRKCGLKKSHAISNKKINLKIDNWLNKKSGRQILMWAHYFDLHNLSFTVGSDSRKMRGIPKEEFTQIYNFFIRELDNTLNNLFMIISRHLNMEKTMIILSSDHGEMFGEHECFLHGTSIYDQEMNVPLIIHYPDKLGTSEIFDNVRTIDIAPTVVEAAGFEVPKFFEGESLIPLISNRKERERLCYMEAPYVDRYGIRLGEYKFIYNGTNYIRMPQKIVIGNELYDLRKDPMELENIIDKKEKVGMRLKKLLLSLLKIKENNIIPSTVLSSETIDELIKLGYLKK